MSILLDAGTRVLVQGITGRDGLFHTGQMLAYGTNILAGVSSSLLMSQTAKMTRQNT